MVNIPAFRLDVIEDGKSVLGMKVVAGKKSSPTPLLVDEMTSVVFSPSWHIPQDIVEKEILPKLETNPGYLDRNNIVADESGHYRQRRVRLDEPDAVAAYVLRDRPEWTHQEIAAAMHSGVEQSVKLTAPLPICLVYVTAWEENGVLKTVPDVCGLDRRRGAKPVKQ